MIEQTTIEKTKAKYIEAKRAATTADELYSVIKMHLEKEQDALRKKWEETNSILIAAYNTRHAELIEAEKNLRETILETYRETKVKTIDENLSVRVNTSLVYKEEDAIKWAKENAPVCLKQSIDKKKFEVLAADLPFVKKEEKIITVISKL